VQNDFCNTIEQERTFGGHPEPFAFDP
jgi:hypothetical protein